MRPLETRVTPELIEVKSVASTKWLRLEELTYSSASAQNLNEPKGSVAQLDANSNRLRQYSRVVRTTTNPDAPADAVYILPLLYRSKNQAPLETLICFQFRPATEGYCIEFSAGLIDANEDAHQTAERELKEETGYIGVAIGSLPSSFVSPISGPERIICSVVLVDLDDPRNKNPETEFDDSEQIHTWKLPFDVNLARTLSDLLRTLPGSKIWGPLMTFAVGLSMGAVDDGDVNHDSYMMNKLIKTLETTECIRDHPDTFSVVERAKAATRPV